MFDTDSVESIAGATQLHDFEPGIAPNGLFWTIPIPQSAVQVDPGNGTARFHMENVAIPDFGDFFSAVTGGPSTPGRASFDIHWDGGGQRGTFEDDQNGFIASLVQGPAWIAWHASNDNGYSYTASTVDQTTVSAAVGHERNGIFVSSHPASGSHLNSDGATASGSTPVRPGRSAAW